MISFAHPHKQIFLFTSLRYKCSPEYLPPPSHFSLRLSLLSIRFIFANRVLHFHFVFLAKSILFQWTLHYRIPDELGK